MPDSMPIAVITLETLGGDVSGRHIELPCGALTSNKRAAQSKVVRMMIPGVGQKAGEMSPQKSSG
jgi:hypothetical protein